MRGGVVALRHRHYIDTGSVQIRFRHVESGVATHNLYVDYLAIQYGA